jgi:poly(3-hydroxybutyrate) depolymerase
VYWPTTEPGPHPLVVFFHGGGVGHRQHREP